MRPQAMRRSRRPRRPTICTADFYWSGSAGLRTSFSGASVAVAGGKRRQEPPISAAEPRTALGRTGWADGWFRGSESRFESMNHPTVRLQRLGGLVDSVLRSTAQPLMFKLLSSYVLSGGIERQRTQASHSLLLRLHHDERLGICTVRGKRLPVPRVLYANDSEAVSKRKLGCGVGRSAIRTRKTNLLDASRGDPGLRPLLCR
jgi:hypothetical protein